MLTDDPSGNSRVYPDNTAESDIFGSSFETEGCEAPASTSSTTLVDERSMEAPLPRTSGSHLLQPHNVCPVQEPLWAQPWSPPPPDEQSSPYPWSIGKLSIAATKYAAESQFHGEDHHFPPPPHQLGLGKLFKSYDDVAHYLHGILDDDYAAGGTNAEQFLLPERCISLTVEILVTRNNEPAGFYTGVLVTCGAIQCLCASLLKKSATQRLDEQYAFCPSMVISSSQLGGEPIHVEAFILGAAIGLHLFWCGYLLINFSILQFWLVINRCDSQCLTKSILEKYAPEFSQVHLNGAAP
ncbi:hypothetical protein BS47DRAFT_579245 [Hydnum rufescens UP504]|uniref:Uncharacterized protein n=1 Tax=Hydnum rufescens UP504 TaxID=1448309 RepID=A0A9P6DI37_9AGAM|nr:hypothetical protein BS47DRAFT_579245 [Hydnum rufescens UP504]